MTATPASQSVAFDHGLSMRGLWILMVTIAAMTACAPLATDIYLPALPNLTDEMHASDGAAQLTLTATFVGIMIGQLIFGPLSDAIGRRRLAITMTLATVVSAAACALAPSIGFLTMARLILGISGGAGIVVGRAIAADIAKGPEAARFFSILVSITMLAPLVGPLIGAGLLTWTDSWRSGFVLLIGFVLLVVLAIVLFVPETLPPDRRHAGGAAELRRGAGLMVRDRIFVGYALTQVFGFATLFTYLASSSFVFQETFELTPTGYSLAFGVVVLAILAAGIVNRRLLLIWSARRLLIGALLVAAVASLVLVPVMAASSPSMIGMIAVLIFVVGTRAPVGANSMALGLERSAYVGTASAILGAMGFGGALLATPLLAVLPFSPGLDMAVAMLVFATLALASTLLLTRGARHHQVADRAFA